MDETSVSPLPNSHNALMWTDFNRLCALGGRLAGSPSEAAGVAFARERLATIGGLKLREDAVEYPGWDCRAAQLSSATTGASFPCTPLLGTASTDNLVAEVLDLGPGREADFDREAARIAGRIVMVRHEYPFAPAHVHRRIKLAMAQRMGAAGFLIAYPEPGIGPVSGSSGRDGGVGIPALGIGAEAAQALRSPPDGTGSSARMRIEANDRPACAHMLIADVPGRGPDWVVVSAHIDGHPLGEGAIDNASGVAVALALARALAPRVAACPRGLRICLFTAEEWGLIGSRLWLERMDPEPRRRMLLDINLDSVVGAWGLTALTSGFRALDDWVKDVAARSDLYLPTHLPLMPNSDHANFAAHGIPALRLLAGFNAPHSNVRYILTAADTRDKIRAGELDAALGIAKALAWEALIAEESALHGLGR